jgi:fatty acid desaturase
MTKNEVQGIDITIPKYLNILLVVVVAGLAVGLLTAASHAESGWILLACGIAFSFINNTLFSLTHDAVHFTLHPNKKLNHLLGNFTAAFYPTGLLFQRTCHFNHHRNNRTDVEMFEAYYPNDNKLLKNLQWYSIFTGFYWLSYLAGLLLYLLLPGLIRKNMLRNTDNKIIKHTGAEPYFRLFDDHPNKRLMKLEIVYAFAFQLMLFYVFDLTFTAWLFCYGMFAINWGAHQYVTHAYTIRDIREGARNIKSNPLFNALLLGYHYHLNHHKYPFVPWIHLHKFSDTEKGRDSFMDIYRKMWKGVVLTTEPSPNELERDFEDLLENGLLEEDGTMKNLADVM